MAQAWDQAELSPCEQDRLWNPMTAESFSISETFCPLESVYAIANENNIWGNIQLSVKPNRIRWDFAQGTIHILRKHLCSTNFNLCVLHVIFDTRRT